MKFIFFIILFASSLFSINSYFLSRIQTDLQTIKITDSYFEDKTFQSSIEAIRTSLEKEKLTAKEITKVESDIASLTSDFEKHQASQAKDYTDEQKENDKIEFASIKDDFANALDHLKNPKSESQADPIKNESKDEDPTDDEEESTEVELGSLVNESSGKVLDYECLKAIASSLPPPFCWNKKYYIPKNCPPEYPYQIYGACHKEKKLLSKFLPNFNKNVKCEEGDKKILAHCKSSKTCKDIGYINCGPLACVTKKSECFKAVSSMVRKSITGLVKTTAFVCSLGSSTALTSVSKAIESIKNGLDAFAKSWQMVELAVGSFFGGSAKDIPELKAKVVEAALPKVKASLERLKATVDDNKIKERIEFVFDNFKKVKDDTKNKEQGWFKTQFEAAKNAFNAKYEDIKKCLKEFKSGKLGDTECWKNYILPVISTFDPTGIVGIVSAFIYPRCPRTLTEWQIK